MQAVLAIARLTFKSAVRYRLVPFLAVLLLGAVFLLPAVIKHDGTARGLTQITLTYTLGLITAVLGMTTLWMACGTLARDIEECQMQVVAVKPVSRGAIWLGKWIGLLLLNALLLGASTAVVYGQLLWRARTLPPEQQAVLRNEVFVARGSFKEIPPDLRPIVDQVLQERLKKESVASMDRGEVRRIVEEQVKADVQVVPPRITRIWRIDLSSVRASLRDEPLHLRIKFFASQKSESGTYDGLWQVGPPESPNRPYLPVKHAAETFHEFEIPANLFDDQGLLTVEFTNLSETALLFNFEDGLEVLYREGGFALNYLRGVLILLCWLGLLAALGLAAASFLSFPVAAFVALALLVVTFSTGTMSQVIEQGTVRAVDPNTGQVAQSNLFDAASVAFFKALLWIVNLARGFSPVDSLSTGRSITWGQLSQAVLQILVVMSGLLAAFGIWTFSRRELATAQSKV